LFEGGSNLQPFPGGSPDGWIVEFPTLQITLSYWSERRVFGNADQEVNLVEIGHEPPLHYIRKLNLLQPIEKKIPLHFDECPVDLQNRAETTRPMRV